MTVKPQYTIMQLILKYFLVLTSIAFY